MTNTLEWPLEASCDTDPGLRWSQSDSNICLDFHGDPVSARLVVFSDGNHHMALEACLQEFISQNPDVDDIFYATTPPSVIVNLLKNGQLTLGNLTLSRQPDVFISPPNIMQQLHDDGLIESNQVFMRSRGNVLLVRKNNQKNIQNVADLLRDDVRLFISNPVTEKASYEVYQQTLENMTQAQGIGSEAMKSFLGAPSDNIIFGERIHHREAPQCLYDGEADVAMVYYHLALRYTRIFPDLFDIVPLEGNSIEPIASDNNITTDYHISLVGNGGQWGKPFLDFMLGDAATKLYAEHGLVRP